MLSSEQHPRTATGATPQDGEIVELRFIVGFFALAFLLAWTAWFGLGWVAADAGLATVDLVDHVEAGRFDRVADAGPGWLLYLVTRVMDFSFTIAGLTMIAVTAGRSGLRQLASRLTAWRFPRRWYALAAAPLLLYLVAAIVVGRSEGGGLVVDGSTLPTVLWSLEAGLLVSLLLRGAMGEELGLRGFALPALQQRLSPAGAALAVGVGWALWHLPALIDDPASAPIIVVLIIGLSFVLTWLFNGTAGSLVGPLLFHAFQNTEEAIETIVPAVVGTDWEALAALGLLVLSVVAVAAVRRTPDHRIHQPRKARQ